MSEDNEPQLTPIAFDLKDLEFPKMLDTLMERHDRMCREWLIVCGVSADYLPPLVARSTSRFQIA